MAGGSSTGSWTVFDYIVIGGLLFAFVVGGLAMFRAIRAANRINPK
ncbi:MAG: hypothetical protein VST70_00580 [Nitrospirota bacterium]|nr:hypothetical protein [Nitrospirota bacterium]